MNELIFRDGGLILIGLVSAYGIFFKKDWMIGWISIVCPMAYFSSYVGFQLSPDKVIGLMLIMRYFVYGSEKELSSIMSVSLRKFVPFFAYVTFITMLLFPIWPNTDAMRGFLYGPGRILSVMTTLTVGLALMITFYNETRTDRGLQLMLRCTFWMVVGVSLHGIYQWIAMRSGLPAIGMSRAFGGLSSTATFRHEGESVYRAFSVVGEPKGLASTASLGMLLLFFSPAHILMGKFSWMKIPAIIIMLTAFILTFSTAGFLILPMGFVACLFFLVRSKQCNFGSMAIVALLVPLLLPFAFSYIQDTDSDFQSMFESRTVDRLEKSGILTPIDQAVLELWQDDPALLVTGCGRGGHSFFIRRYTDAYPGYIIYARGALGLTADYGLIGMSMLFYAFAFLLFKYVNRVRLAPFNPLCAPAIVFVVHMVVRSMTSSQYYSIWAAMGVVAALHLRTLMNTEIEEGL